MKKRTGTNGIAKNRRYAVALTALLITSLAGAAMAESIWVKSDNVQIRSGKGAVYPVVATAPKGTELTVIERDGKWIKVQAGDQQGYIYETAASASKVSGGGNLLSNMGAGSDMSTGAAAKGLEQQTETYASSKNLDTGPLNKLIALRKSITPQEWQSFTAEGKVGAQ